jgi:hypothetical protein
MKRSKSNNKEKITKKEEITERRKSKNE